MSFTRFFDDPCRIAKQNQQSTDVGKWILNVPGNGANPAYMSDPHIRIQTWGGNLMTNSVDLESELRGVNRRVGKDCLGRDEYTKFNVPTSKVSYPTCSSMYTEESRTIMPAWTVRDEEQVQWAILPLNPQENTCIPFQNNLSTRILEKDYYSRKNQCIPDTNVNFSPLPVTVKNGTQICTNNNSCGTINK
jgi:hypothetical protein